MFFTSGKTDSSNSPFGSKAARSSERVGSNDIGAAVSREVVLIAIGMVLDVKEGVIGGEKEASEG